MAKPLNNLHISVSESSGASQAGAAQSAEALLRRVVMAWDADLDMEFTALIREARRFLGLKLADEYEDEAERRLLEANGLLDDSEKDRP